MLFNSLQFILFFALLFIIYYVTCDKYRYMDKWHGYAYSADEPEKAFTILYVENVSIKIQKSLLVEQVIKRKPCDMHKESLS